MFVKGTSIRNIFAGVESAFGEQGVMRVKGALSPEWLERVEPVVLAASNYPVELSAAIHEAIRTELGAGGLTANRRVGAAAARIDFGGIYRVFLRVADYETLLRGLDRAWRQYNSQGRVIWEHVGERDASGRVVDVTGFTEAMWTSIGGRLETILVLAGAKKASVHLGECSGTHVVLLPKWSR
jgi:hypothetical protein